MRLNNYLITYWATVVASVCLWGLVALGGCKHNRVSVAEPTQAAWSESGQNAGFLYFTNGNAGVLTSSAVERYNYLAGRYGKRFAPPIKPWDGITNAGGIFIISPQHLEHFVMMTYWFRNDNKQ